MAGKFRIKSFNQLYVLFLLISSIIAGIVTVTYITSYRQNLLKPIDKQLHDGGWKILYQDLNHNGYSEGIEISSNKLTSRYFLIFQSYREHLEAEKIIDQFDFEDEIIFHRLFFEDITGDDFDEAVLFTQAGDSLFLSVIDVYQKSFLIRRRFFLKVQEPNPFHKWDIRGMFCEFLDVNRDGKKELIFAIHSGKSLHPRGVYIYDLEEREFINSFETNAGISDLLLYDMSGDGREEIILVGRATGNIDTGYYTDQKSWLFVLDQNLKPVFQPKCFSEFPSSLFASPVTINGKSYLFLVSSYLGNKEHILPLYLMDSAGLIIKQKNLYMDAFMSVNIAKENLAPVIYLASASGEIRILDMDLNVLEEASLNLKMARLFGLADLDHDGEKELVIHSASGVHIFNHELSIRAEFKDNGDRKDAFSLRKNGPEKNIQIAYNDYENYHLLSYQKNRYFYFIPFIFIGITAGFALIIYEIFRLFRLVYIYLFYFLFSLKKSSTGLIILNHDGNVIYLNGAVQKYLDLTRHLSRGDHYKICLNERPEIVSAISETIDQEQVIKKEISIARQDFHFKGEVSVTPFKSPVGLVFAYMVEIKDFTSPVMTDRLKSWTHSVQKMTHDIKQPLSSISLNLKSLQLRLEPLPGEVRKEINDDIQMMKSEIDRVRLLTNSFLKFVNLDYPKMQFVDVADLVAASLKRYDAYMRNGFQINLEIPEKLPVTLLDPQQIEMIIHTIIENAIDALKGTGLIQINVILAQYLNKSFADYIQFEILDNGPGIPAEIREKIFEPFFTTKTSGTGMGLALARKIIEDHRGFIDIHSDGKLGTTVRFAIPVVD